MIDKSAPTDYPQIIDAHVHLGPFRAFHIPDHDIDGVVGAMDRLGIDVAVIAAHAGISSDVQFGNDLVLAAAERYPDRVLGYCCINPNYSAEVPAELERCFAHPAFRGVKLHPELHGDYPMDGPAYVPMWQFAADHETPVLSHSYFNGDRLEVFGALARQYPSVPVILGHSGLDFGIHRVVELVRQHPNLWLDLCGALSWDGVVEELAAAVGADRLLFGTDLPFINGATQLGTLAYAKLPRSEVEMIIGRNAARLFGVPDSGRSGGGASAVPATIRNGTS
jgi:predicted TIM-barrel fold metal-dependent hydrolase